MLIDKGKRISHASTWNALVTHFYILTEEQFTNRVPYNGYNVMDETKQDVIKFTGFTGKAFFVTPFEGVKMELFDELFFKEEDWDLIRIGQDILADFNDKQTQN